MNKKQILWTLKEALKMAESFDENKPDFDLIVEQAKQITDKAKDNEYVRMLVLDVVEAFEVEYGEGN